MKPLAPIHSNEHDSKTSATDPAAGDTLQAGKFIPIAPDPLSEKTYQRLRRPLSPVSPRNIGFALQKLALNTAGRLSHGIKIGWETGFDSGESLDYVYRNRPEGTGPLGRWIDRQYLNSPGWCGIRQRGGHLRAAIEEAIHEVHARKNSVHILDVACGGGRYVLETIAQHPTLALTAELRDWSPTALEKTRALANELDLRNVTVQRGNAFDPHTLAAIQPQPDVAIVSGLYELFPDNEPIQQSLSGLGTLLAPSSLLIYTNQPWHPQLEMIARVLPNRDGNPWIMRTRSQMEMDSLVRGAGFENMRTRTDDKGIFTVSIAYRR
ncbi:MAG: class I SAM-dependent methyltransferase family protein [Verrucomicrobiota bacterium]